MFELDPIIFSLSNGVKVAYLRREALVAHMGVMIHGGSRFERPDEEGLAHFIEHCIFKGTKKRKAFDIFTDLDSVGGELNAYTNKEEICVHASFRKLHFNIAAELLADIVQNATFPDEELAREKDVVLDEIISYMDSPTERIFDDFEALIFKGNSLGYNTLGTKKSVNSFTREKILSYVNRYFKPGNIVISFVGDIPIKELQRTLENEFGGADSYPSEKGEVEHINEELLDVLPFKLIEKKSNFQTHTVIGGRAPSYNDSNRRSMTLLTNVLGGPALNSKLILSIREKYGYAYNIEANYTSYSDVGFWSVDMGTDKKYLKKAVNWIYAELEEFCTNSLKDKELEQAKEQLKGHIALSLDSNMELMFNIGKSIMIHGKVDTVKEIYEQIDGINHAELKAVLDQYFNPKYLSELIYTF